MLPRSIRKAHQAAAAIRSRHNGFRAEDKLWQDRGPQPAEELQRKSGNSTQKVVRAGDRGDRGRQRGMGVEEEGVCAAMCGALELKYDEVMCRQQHETTRLHACHQHPVISILAFGALVRRKLQS
jgi:hypothetical protein